MGLHPSDQCFPNQGVSWTPGGAPVGDPAGRPGGRKPCSALKPSREPVTEVRDAGRERQQHESPARCVEGGVCSPFWPDRGHPEGRPCWKMGLPGPEALRQPPGKGGNWAQQDPRQEDG